MRAGTLTSSGRLTNWIPKEIETQILPSYRWSAEEIGHMLRALWCATRLAIGSIEPTLARSASSRLFYSLSLLTVRSPPCH